MKNNNELVQDDLDLPQTHDTSLPDDNLEEAQVHDPFLSVKDLQISSNTPNVSITQIINQVLQRVNLGDAISKVKKGVEYVVQVPLKYKEAYEAGEVFIVQNQTTKELRPQLARVVENGRHEFVAPLDMVERNVAQGTTLQNIANNYHNLAMQQQMAQLSALMEKTHKTVLRIEEGQYDDRIGQLMAGRNEIVLALSDPEHINEAELNAGRNNLQIGCAQLVKTVQRRASQFPKISKSRLIRDLKLLFHSDYYQGLDEEYNRIEDCFDFYLQGTKMLAASYAFCGESEKAMVVFDQAKSALEQIDFSRVERMALIHSSEKDWLSAEAPKYIESAKSTCLEEAQHYEMLSIKVSGEQLLEAFEHGRTERIQEKTAQ